MTPAGIKPAAFRFVAQHLKHCATAVPTLITVRCIITGTCRFYIGGGSISLYSDQLSVIMFHTKCLQNIYFCLSPNVACYSEQ